jgi:hypothetical protein
MVSPIETCAPLLRGGSVATTNQRTPAVDSAKQPLTKLPRTHAPSSASPAPSLCTSLAACSLQPKALSVCQRKAQCRHRHPPDPRPLCPARSPTSINNKRLASSYVKHHITRHPYRKHREKQNRTILQLQHPLPTCLHPIVISLNSHEHQTETVGTHQPQATQRLAPPMTLPTQLPSPTEIRHRTLFKHPAGRNAPLLLCTPDNPMSNKQTMAGPVPPTYDPPDASTLAHGVPSTRQSVPLENPDQNARPFSLMHQL